MMLNSRDLVPSTGDGVRLSRRLREVGVILLLLVTGLAGTASAGIRGRGIASEGHEGYDYPELTVVPRASERLRIEAGKEGSRSMTAFLPIQISGALTLASALASYDATNTGPYYAGIGVGGGWLVLSTFLAFTYHPYAEANREVSPMPKGSVREDLARERMAESEIQGAARTGERLRWLSVLTNLGTSVYIAASSNGNGSSNRSPLAQGLNIASIMGSLAPAIFRFYWSDVASEQNDYKKRIYGPVAETGFLSEPGTGHPSPGMLLSFHF